MSSRTALRRPLLLGLDQAISSGSNLTTTLAAASLLPTSGFGAWALGGSLFGLALAAGRMTGSERLAIGQEESATSVIAVSSVIVGFGSVVSLLSLWWVVGDMAVVGWVGAAIPILVQDRLRFVAISHNPLAAILSDALWLALSIAIWVIAASEQYSGVTGALLVTIVPPLGSLLLLLILLRNRLTFSVERDSRVSLAESRYVADSWLQIAAVFVALSISAAVGSLVTVARARALMLIFQPFVSISYAGRLMVLSSRSDARVRRWPAVAASACGAYAALSALVLLGLERVGGDLGELWAIGPAAFMLMSVAQCARSYHQSVTDIQRRSVPQDLVRSRLVFAVVLVGSVGPLVVWRELEGLATAWALAYVLGALRIMRRDHDEQQDRPLAFGP